ncbi:hypothetical protein GGS20DRAFT_172831 [Poronia punctata]|nr:hypothetical protein GGS20DRAFT_172831 [Poronia punctata]
MFGVVRYIRQLRRDTMWSEKSSRDTTIRGDSDDSQDPFLTNKGVEEAESQTLQPSRRRRRCRFAGYVVGCSALGGSIVLAALLFLSIVLSIARNLWGIEDDPDKIFAGWGKPGTGTGSLAWYPTDFLRDVTPVPCHSHNDYWRKVPVFSALHVGCVGIEADVWLFDKDPALYVGHDRAALTPYRTFQSLYVNPLVDILKQSNPDTPLYDGNRRGVFDRDPEQTVVLLIDLKTDGNKTLQEVEAQLEPLRAGNWLTYIENGTVHKGQVTVVGTGNTPFDILVQNSTYRDIFFDAPLDELYEDLDAAVDDHEADTETFVYNSTNSFYASVDFHRSIGTVWWHLTEDQLRLIRGQIKGAHRRGLKVRYWNTPTWPVSLRNRIWHTLIAEGADILNADDVKAAARKRW